jgi:hypothetical protein
MSETPKRRNLVSLVPLPEPLPEQAIAAIAERNGFESPASFAASAPKAAKPTPAKDDIPSGRRRRQPTGRDHQFNTRLRRDTLDFIYAEANERNVPIAQVIEEATEALQREQRRSKPGTA